MENPVAAVPWKSALDSFLSWLKKYQNVFLIAHNGKRFDLPVLISACTNIGALDTFKLEVLGLIDSLNLFKKVYPKLTSYKQADIAFELLNITYNAHDAKDDVVCLAKLVSHAMLDDESAMLAFSYSPMTVYLNQNFYKERNKNMPSLTQLVGNSVMKTATAENIAGSGLQLKHLRIICKRNGEDGLYNTFTAKNREGRPRMTSCKRTLEKVVPSLVHFFENN
jgi:DNA polymerase III epsilon subunit-like protein